MLAPIKKSIYNLDYLSCGQSRHFGEDLTYICLEDSCSGRRLICSVCQQTSHNTHNSMPLKEYLSKIVDYQNSQNKINYLVYVNELEQLKNKSIGNLIKLKDSFIDTIEDMILKTKTQFRKSEEKLMNLVKFGQGNNSWIKGLENVIQKNNIALLNDILQSLTQIFPSVEIDREGEEHNITIQQRLDLLMQVAQNQTNRYTSQLSKLQQKIKLEMPKSVLIQYLDVFRGDSKVQWDPVLKGKGFTISQKIITQTVAASDSERFALTTAAFTSKHKKKVYWGFKIKKLVGWVGVGACLKNVMKSVKFKFNYTNVGHGSYLISANGYSWSHSEKTSNSAYKSFSFTTNDTIYMQYDPTGHTIKFIKEWSTQQYSLNIQELPQGEELCPCVNLCSISDAVQIVPVPKNIVF